MNDLKFLKGLSTDYTAVDPKVETTFYFTTDDGKLYLGSKELTTEADVKEAVAKVTTHETEIAKLKSEIAALVGGEEGQSIHDLIEAAVANEHKTYVGEKTSLTTEDKTTIVAAINEVDANADAAKAAADQAKTESVVTIEKSTPEDVATRYTIKQNGETISGITIDIPKDMVVKSGEVKDITAEQIAEEGEYYEKVTEAGKYIILTIANDESTQLFIKVDTLVDIYKAASAEEKTKDILVVVDNDTREISATIQAGAVTTEKLANNSVSTEKIQESAITSTTIQDGAVTASKIGEGAVTLTAITDGTLTKDKFDEAVQSSLGKADSALQASSITESEKNGAIKVGETDIDIHGLKSLAYKDESELALTDYVKATEITESAETNGAISVKGEDVQVHGLKSLAYMDETDLSLTDYAKKADIKESTVDGNIAVGETNVPVHNLSSMITAGAEVVVSEKFVWEDIPSAE